MNTKSLITGSLVSRNYCQPFRLGSEFIQKAPKTGIYNLVWPIFPLRESVQIRRFFWSVFSRIRIEYGPEGTPYLDIFHTVFHFILLGFFVL